MATDLARHAAALLARAEGHLDAAREDLARAVDGVLAMGALAFAPPILLDLVEVALAAGEAAEAARAVEQLERLAKEIDRDLYRAIAAVGRALLRLETGDSEGATEPARAAVTLLDGSGYDVFLGRALDLLGRATGDRAEAVDALRGLGASGRRAAAAAMGPASLTARELEVARLAALRLTAAEIAHELFI